MMGENVSARKRGGVMRAQHMLLAEKSGCARCALFSMMFVPACYAYGAPRDRAMILTNGVVDRRRFYAD